MAVGIDCGRFEGGISRLSSVREELELDVGETSAPNNQLIKS